jgi:hypothetical protein
MSSAASDSSRPLRFARERNTDAGATQLTAPLIEFKGSESCDPLPLIRHRNILSVYGLPAYLRMTWK